MKSNKFETIIDAYHLVKGTQIRAKQNPEEIFTLTEYQADKRGYMVYPLDHGVMYQDFGVLITESELMKDYEIGSKETVQPKAGIFAQRKVA